MNYKDAFAVDSIHFTQRKEECTKIKPEYLLNNFDYYEPKLIDDFYLKYFLRKLLIDIDILMIKEFLEYHYENTKNTKLFLEVLSYKVIPKAKDLVLRANFSMEGGEYYNKVELDDGFIETEGRILKPDFNDSLLYHVIALDNLQEDIKSRISIISVFMERINKLYSSNNDGTKLVWSGKPSHLGFFIAKFIEEGYITAPQKRNGDINYQELSRNIIKSFDFDSKTPSDETLRRYSNIDSDKFFKLNKRFNDQGFLLPNSKTL